MCACVCVCVSIDETAGQRERKDGAVKVSNFRYRNANWKTEVTLEKRKREEGTRREKKISKNEEKKKDRTRVERKENGYAIAR